MKLQLSSIAIAVVLLTCLIIDFDLKNWKKQDRVIEWDVHWYYSYLPAQFIYDDIKLAKSDYLFAKDYYLFWPVYTADGTKLIKTTMGMSILYAPFFFIAHAFASSPLSDSPANGFSEPYKFFLLLSAVFYLMIGLDFLRKILSRLKFSDKHIAVTILLIGAGTNLLSYSSQTAPMPHTYNFFLFSAIIYCTMRWYESPGIINTLLIGFLAGLISLIRPSNIIILLFFFLYNVSNLTELKQRVILFRQKIPLLLLMFLPFFLVWLPQFIYWKSVTGKYLFYSYTNERFFFNHPRIMEGLFSFRKGWLIYTPMMAFALAGIFLMKDEARKLQFSISIFLFLNIYIIFSWWCWWYGGTFGQRSMIESYALLAIPFASFIKFLSEKKWYFNILFYGTAIFFIWLNIFQTYQFEEHSLHWDGMTRELYFKQFGKLHKINDFDNYVDRPDYEKAQGKIPGREEEEKEIIKNTFTQKKEQSRKLINLKASNGKYLCADQSKKNIVVANRDNAASWETFYLIMFDKNECAIRASDKHFFSAELGHQGEVTATRDLVNFWETFTITELDSGYVAFKAYNNKYLSLDNESLQLAATGNSLGTQEKFILIPE